MDYFLYADQDTLDLLNSTQKKSILIGGDFGYANFGDILQLKGTINFHRATQAGEPIPLYSLSAISGPDYIDRIKRDLGLRGLLFFTGQPTDTRALNMIPVSQITNATILHLYGGGMLNSMWGDQVLKVVEHFLTHAPHITYIASGQQVSPEIRPRLEKHLRAYPPMLFGVRDFESLERMQQWRLDAQFSFDDAYECLMDLAAQIPSKKNNTLLGHLNFSSYTATDINQKIGYVVDIFTRTKIIFPEHRLTLLNAYNEKRSHVCDSLTSVVKLENNFPYKSFSVVDLAHAAYTNCLDDPTSLAGQLGISCSYHVTLLLHLAGIPCWLIAKNAYYNQKAAALNGYENFEDFLQQQQAPDYCERITLRASFLTQLTSCLQKNKQSSTLDFPQSKNIKHAQPFVYKGHPPERSIAAIKEKIKIHLKFHKRKAIKKGFKLLSKLIKPSYSQ